jgi:hypothetical protein
VNATFSISSVFPKHLFWDVDQSQLDVVCDKSFIIPRALYMTNKASFEKDISVLEKLYSESDIIEYLLMSKEKVSIAIREMVVERYNRKLLSQLKYA